uniref:Uncharacterized protein n=1 Tax=Acrobeloides nanus TaxID=290746 RepID=A0A914CZ51_9BILA
MRFDEGTFVNDLVSVGFEINCEDFGDKLIVFFTCLLEVFNDTNITLDNYIRNAEFGKIIRLSLHTWLENHLELYDEDYEELTGVCNIERYKFMKKRDDGWCIRICKESYNCTEYTVSFKIYK